VTEAVIRPAPVKKSVLVKTTPEHAFEVFTTGMGRWWPASHSTAKSPQKDVRMEPKRGGRWYEVGEDGSETPWGDVLAWEPPARVLLAWRVGADWKYDPEFLTHIEVTFVPEGDAIRVTLEHRDLERFGDKCSELRIAFDSDRGWSGMLALYREKAEG
jgi:hypothetical protein